MRCPSEISRKFGKIFTVFVIFPLLAGAVDDQRLWLPAEYSRLFLDLKEAAMAAEGLERCVNVLRGTIDLDQSTASRPIYRILCRQRNGRSYNEMVDGQTFETLTTKIVVPEPPSPGELEAQRLAEEKRIAEAREARRQKAWELCESALKSRLRLMQDVSWLSDFPPAPVTFNDQVVVFTLDFNAIDVYGKPLRYRSTCEYLSEQALSVNIFGRETH